MGLLSAGIVLGVLLSPPDPEVVRGALDRVLHERTYQTELPGPDGRPIGRSEEASDSASSRVDRGRTRHRTGRTAERDDPREETRRESDRSVGSSGLGAALFYVIVGVLAVLLIVFLVSEWKGRAKRGTAPLSVATPASGPLPMAEVPLDEVDALAAEGRYAEAVHLLLLRTIAALPKTTRDLPASLTSREILHLVPFRPGAQEAMGGLVDAVEVSLFGGRPVLAAAYHDCRARFDRFVRLQAGSPA